MEEDKDTHTVHKVEYSSWSMAPASLGELIAMLLIIGAIIFAVSILISNS